MRTGSPGCTRFASKFTLFRSPDRMVGLGRLELPTSPLSGVRSNHLSYRPNLLGPEGWWSWSGSNRRPPECKSGALPAELQPLLAERKNILEADWTRAGSDRQKPAQNHGSNSQINSSGDPDTRAFPAVACREARSVKGNGCHLLHKPVQTVCLFSVTPPTVSLRKEVIQPQVLLRLPCYDFTPIMNHTLGRCLPRGSACRLLVQSTFVM
jgi:hypothetical protein